MILGKHHWLYEEPLLKSILPLEIWVIVFTYIHDQKQNCIEARFSRGSSSSEEAVLMGTPGEYGYPYVETYISNGYLIVTHFHRIITPHLRPEVDFRRLSYTLGKMHDLQTRLNRHKDDEVCRRWFKARIELYKKDIFKTNIISRCFIYSTAPEWLDLVSIKCHFVWDDKRSNYLSLYF